MTPADPSDPQSGRTGEGPTNRDASPGGSDSTDEPHEASAVVDRRTVLAATAGIGGLAGCLGGDDPGTVGDEDGGGDGSSDDGGTDTTARGDAPPGECPMLPGSYLTHDTGAKPLPVDFEYPAAMEGSWTYQNPDSWAGSNTILGRVERGEDHDGDGDVRMALAVRYRSNSPGERDAWYEEADAESLTTVDFNGESVEFLVADPGGPHAGEHNGWQARGMLPYQPENLATTAYFQAVLTVETLLFRVDAGDVTEACGKNQRDTLARTTESLSLNDQTTFDQYVE